MHVGLHGIGGGILAPSLMDGVQFEQRLVVLLVLDVAEHPVVPDGTIVGQQAQGAVIVGDGIVVLALLDAAEATQLVDAHHKGISVDGFGTILLGAAKIVEMVFGYPAQKPRLIKKRFLRDNRVEILHRQHIVRVVEG